MSNGIGFRWPEKAGRNAALLSCAASRIRNLVNSPETVNSGTFDNRSLLYHSPSDQSDPNHGCHGPMSLRTNGSALVGSSTYKRRSVGLNKSHATASTEWSLALRATTVNAETNRAVDGKVVLRTRSKRALTSILFRKENNFFFKKKTTVEFHDDVCMLQTKICTFIIAKRKANMFRLALHTTYTNFF